MSPVKLRRYGFASVALLAAAAACLLLLRPPRAVPSALPPAGGAGWPMYQRFPSHNAVLPEPAGLRLHWMAYLGGRVNGGLAVADGTIYADSFDRKLYAIDEQTGKIRWSAQTGGILMSTPVVENGLVIVGSGQDGWLKPHDANSQIWGRPGGDDEYAFSTRDGRLVWKMHTVGDNMPSPAFAAGTLYLGNGDLHVYAIDPRTGKPRWTVPLAGVPTMSSMNVDAGMGFISTCHNAPYVCETRAIDLRDGRTVWTNPIGGSDCAPAIDGGKVFENGEQDDTVKYHTGGMLTVAAMDERTGKTLWTYRTGYGSWTYLVSKERQIAGTAFEGVLYQPLGNAAQVVALDEENGKELWTFHTEGPVKMSPVVKGEDVYFGDTAGIFYRVNRATGALVHASSYLQPFSTSPPVIVGDTVFVVLGPIVMAVPAEEV